MSLNNVGVPGWMLVILPFVVHGFQLCSAGFIFIPASQRGRTRSIVHGGGGGGLRLEGLNNENFFLTVLWLEIQD